MITLAFFATIVERLGNQALEDIAWAETLATPKAPDDFAVETIYVIWNSGMKASVARGIFDRTMRALRSGKSAGSAFGHPGKAKAIDDIWARRKELFEALGTASDLLEFCESLPYIGATTKYHVAKNFGADLVKPDVHLLRLAAHHHCTPTELCADLARHTNYRVATIDTLLWRACATGVLDSRTGELTGHRLYDASRASADDQP